MVSPHKVTIIAGKNIDDIAAAEVLLRFLLLRRDGDVSISVTFVSPCEAADKIRYINALGHRMFCIGLELQQREAGTVMKSWGGAPPLPPIWSRSIRSEKYIRGIDGNARLGEYAVSPPCHSLTLAMCRIILGRYKDRKGICEMAEAGEERYAELRTEWVKSPAAILLPKVIDPQWLFTSLSRESSLKLSELASNLELEKVCETEEIHARIAADAARYSELSGTTVGIAILKEEHSGDKELIAPLMLKRCDIALLYIYGRTPSFYLYRKGRERLYPIAEATAAPIAKGRANCTIIDDGEVCSITDIKIYSRFKKPDILINEGVMPALEEYMSQLKDRIDSRFLMRGA